MILKNLERKIKNKTARIGIIGIGYVGLPLAAEFGKKIDVIGFDLKSERIHELKAGIDATMELATSDLESAKHLSFTSTLSDLQNCNVFIITVPTPIYENKQPNLEYLISATSTVAKFLKKGDLVIVNDHINLLFDNPLRGKNIEEHGTRFPDMSEPYNKELSNVLWACSKNINCNFHSGVYAAWQGPSLETRAEYRMLKILGADLVGMSTVPEVIVANHMNLPCAVVSVLTDECDPDKLNPVSIEEIITVAKKTEPLLTELFTKTISQL